MQACYPTRVFYQISRVSFFSIKFEIKIMSLKYLQKDVTSDRACKVHSAEILILMRKEVTGS